MAKNYSNITITSTQSDDYISDERSIDLTGFSRRIFTVNATDRLLWVDDDNDFSSLKDDRYAYRITYVDVKYVRIKNIDSSNTLQVGLINGTSGATADMDSFQVLPEEMFILYDLNAFRFYPHQNATTGLSTSTNQIVGNIIIGALANTVQVDTYIGFNQ